MKMKNDLKHKSKCVKQILEDHEIEIYEQYQKDNQDVFFLCDGIVAILKSKEKLEISFHVAMKPNKSAMIATTLMSDVELNISIHPPFLYDDKGNIIEGDDAEQMYEKNCNDMIMNDFTNKQREMFYLYNAIPAGEA